MFNKTDALIIIDVQNDFIPGGALAVTDGDAIVKPIVALAQEFHDIGAVVAMTQDWHPEGHKSFASSHGVEPFSVKELPYGEQTMWPDHCVQRTEGGDFHADLSPAEDTADVIIRKGTNPNVDSYSAFYENDRKTATGLAGFLRDRGVTRVFLVGLAYDFCVGYSALDARALGLEAVIIRDLTRAIDLGGSVATMEKEFELAGVEIVNSADLGEV